MYSGGAREVLSTQYTSDEQRKPPNVKQGGYATDEKAQI